MVCILFCSFHLGTEDIQDGGGGGKRSKGYSPHQISQLHLFQPLSWSLEFLLDGTLNKESYYTLYLYYVKKKKQKQIKNI